MDPLHPEPPTQQTPNNPLANPEHKLHQQKYAQSRPRSDSQPLMQQQRHEESLPQLQPAPEHNDQLPQGQAEGIVSQSPEQQPAQSQLVQNTEMHESKVEGVDQKIIEYQCTQKTEQVEQVHQEEKAEQVHQEEPAEQIHEEEPTGEPAQLYIQPRQETSNEQFLDNPLQPINEEKSIDKEEAQAEAQTNQQEQENQASQNDCHQEVIQKVDRPEEEQEPTAQAADQNAEQIQIFVHERQLEQESPVATAEALPSIFHKMIKSQANESQGAQLEKKVVTEIRDDEQPQQRVVQFVEASQQDEATGAELIIVEEQNREQRNLEEAEKKIDINILNENKVSHSPCENSILVIQNNETIFSSQNQSQNQSNQIGASSIKAQLFSLEEKMQKIEEEHNITSPKKQVVGKIVKHKPIIHERKVFQIVEDLRKNDDAKAKAAIYVPSPKKNKFKDLSKLDPKIRFESNVMSLTIGELFFEDEPEKQTKKLLQQIDDLKEKLAQYEQGSQPKQETSDLEGYQEIQSNFRTKLGRIYKKSELNNSRVLRDVQQQQKIPVKVPVQCETAPTQTRNRFASTMGFWKVEQSKVNIDSKTAASQFRIKKQQQKASILSQTPADSVKVLAQPKAKVSHEQNEQNLEFELEDKINAEETDKYEFTENFREQVESKMIEVGEQIPKNDWKQRQLVQLASTTFMKFGIDIYSEQAVLNIKKYKNCISFIIDAERTILWYYEGRFYFGGWQISPSGQGEKHGFGYEYLPQKYAYLGNFNHNKRHGDGHLITLNKEKDIIYSGEWSNGLKQGFGRQSEANGTDYIGQWLENRKHGFGHLKVLQQGHFQGNFIKGIKNGQGNETFKNGDSYKGEYFNGKFHGKGRYQWKNNSEYEGDFDQGSRQGCGIWKSNIAMKQFDQYEGQYKSDKKQGFGVYSWKDGTCYEGEFVNDLKHGEGSIKYSDGKLIKYQWHEGNPITKATAVKSQVNSAVIDESKSIRSDQRSHFTNDSKKVVFASRGRGLSETRRKSLMQGNESKKNTQQRFKASDKLSLNFRKLE